MLSLEKIETNWETFSKLCNRLCDDNIGMLLSHIEDRAAVCPASSRESQYGAYPGGMVEHVLKVASNMRGISEIYSNEIQIASILKVSLLHDLGKIGDLEEDYFIEQDSDWHREKLGQMYKYNENLAKMSISHRTLWMLQKFGVELTCDEWLAIQLSQGSHFEENRFYVGSEPTLALALQHAKSLTIHNVKSTT